VLLRNVESTLQGIDMASHNEHTGDAIQTKPSTKYADNYDAIFRKEQPKKDHLNHLLKDEEMGFNVKDNGS